MPELPDVDLYVEHIARRVVGSPLEDVRVASPFVVRTADPPISAAKGRVVRKVSRLGKRIVLELGPDPPLCLVIHLMVAGRFKWAARGAKIPGRIGLAAFDFPSGTLLFREASTKKRASIHLVRPPDLASLDRGGLEVAASTPAEFAERMRRENRTLKRALTDPHILSGIGNAYSDEILHRAKLSPVRLTQRMDDETLTHLRAVIVDVLAEWTARLRESTGDAFPEEVTAFRPEMAVHGKYGKPCPTCGGPVQRIRYADNESNYCPSCQTEGKLLADRSLSRLMRGDWPKTLDELEARKTALGARPGAPAPAKVEAEVKAAKPRRRR